MKLELDKIYLLILLFLLQLSLDLSTNECIKRIKGSEKCKAISILIIHHLISILSNFGWIFNNRLFLKIYLTIPIITMIHWLTNRDKCILSSSFNKLCGYVHYEYFHDFFYFLRIKKLHPAYYLLTIGIAIYKLIKLKS